MALSEKERMMLYLLLAVIGVLVLVWFIRDNSKKSVHHNRPHLSMPVLSDQQKMALRSLGIHDLNKLKYLSDREIARLRDLGIQDIDKLVNLAKKDMPALRNLGAKDIAALKAKYCPVCQDQSGECNCPQVDCPPAAGRPTMEDAQNICAGQDPTQGVPWTTDCINAIYNVYGCNNRYPPGMPVTDYDANGTWDGFNNDAKAWASMTDDVHRNGCYAPGAYTQ